MGAVMDGSIVDNSDVNSSTCISVKGTFSSIFEMNGCSYSSSIEILSASFACRHWIRNSEHSVRLHQTIKTSSYIYMMQEYANGFDLAVLLKMKKKVKQEECRLIMRQLVAGIKDVWALGIIHRDMKLANILLHFPDNPELDTLNRQ